MKLINAGPAGHLRLHQRLQFMLEANDLIPDRLRQSQRNKKAPMPGWIVIRHHPQNLSSAPLEFKL